MSTPTWVALGGGYAPTAIAVRGVLNVVNGAAMAAPNNNYGAYHSNANPPPVAVDISGAVNQVFYFILESGSIYWASNASTNTIGVLGWVDNI